MKTFATTLIALCVTTFSLAQSGQPAATAEGVRIRVTIDNVTGDQGKVLISLHTRDTFMRGEGVSSQESAIRDGKVEFTFTGVQPGTYALIALHDANGNERMDYEASGMPSESWGMSGNDMTMGPPNFDLAKFEVGSDDLELKIVF